LSSSNGPSQLHRSTRVAKRERWGTSLTDIEGSSSFIPVDDHQRRARERERRKGREMEARGRGQLELVWFLAVCTVEAGRCTYHCSVHPGGRAASVDIVVGVFGEGEDVDVEGGGESKLELNQKSLGFSVLESCIFRF